MGGLGFWDGWNRLDVEPSRIIVLPGPLIGPGMPPRRGEFLSCALHPNSVIVIPGIQAARPVCLHATRSAASTHIRRVPSPRPQSLVHEDDGLGMGGANLCRTASCSHASQRPPPARTRGTDPEPVRGGGCKVRLSSSGQRPRERHPGSRIATERSAAYEPPRRSRCDGCARAWFPQTP